MTVGHLLCTEGVTGGLWLGALVDAGTDIDAMRGAVAGLGLGPVELSTEQVRVDEIAATRVSVDVDNAIPRLPGWDDLRGVLEGADIDELVRERSLEVARRLVEAESAVHRTDVADVRFHELGDPDTIIEIVAAVTGLRSLGIDHLTCGPVAVGSGTVMTAHGRLPIPPPAVVDLLHGFVIHAGDRERELTTPTGAALLAELTSPTDRLPAMQLNGCGRGATCGRDRSSTSMLTLLLGDTTTPTSTASSAWSRTKPGAPTS